MTTMIRQNSQQVRVRYFGPESDIHPKLELFMTIEEAALRVKIDVIDLRWALEDEGCCNVDGDFEGYGWTID